MSELKNKKVLFVIGAIFLLILVIGGTFAYFQIVANNNATTSSISGEGELVGQATLSTNITELKLNLTAEIMHKDNVGKVYYATPTGKAVESSEVTDDNGRYTLATANVTESDVAFDCTYAYDISATTSKEITDGSDENLKVIINDGSFKKTYTLKHLLTGVTHTGKITNLEYGTDKKVTVEAYVENTSDKQNNLSGNEFTITISPKSGEEGFSCDVYNPSSYLYVVNEKTNINDMIKLEVSSTTYLKVSNDILTRDELMGATFSVVLNNDINPILNFEVNENNFIQETNYYYTLGPYFGPTEYFELIYVVFDKVPEDSTVNGYEDPLRNVDPGVYIIYFGDTSDPDFSYNITFVSQNQHSYMLTADTDITNMIKVKYPLYENDENTHLVKVSSDTLSLEELRNCVGGMIDVNGNVANSLLTDDLIFEKENNLIITYGETIGMVIAKESFELDGVTIPEAGIYLLHSPSNFQKIRLILP